MIARVLEVDTTTIVLAAAQGLGLDARQHTPRPGGRLAQRLPAGSERLSEQTCDAILALVEAAVADT